MTPEQTQILVALGKIEQRLESIEERIEDVHEQAVATNGRVTTIEKWRERVEGVLLVFSWWKPAVAVAAGSGLVWLAAHY